ncbi:MAG: glutamate--tRNA ligase [Oligoflexia bacterium]|nr:glutamate--tRNA ligase [Oligoflexia bacterium]
MTNRNVRVRFAPSPTGYLHVGGARSILFNWLYAKHVGGTFILRVEDTDQARSTREFEEMQKQDIKWLGLNWDEGPDVDAKFGPYRQSERQHIYKEHADKLLTSGEAYYCFCTDEELEVKKQVAMKQGRPPQYDGKCRHLPAQDVKLKLEAGQKGAVRFWIKKPKKYLLKDLIRGDVEFQEGMVGDFVILRSDGMPVYNFCCVIDDHLMEITHVLRAEEHLSNTVRQLMLYESYGWVAPEFGHMSVVLGSDKQKLSKRHGATSVNEYRQQGYLKEAINNYIALLGWSSPDGREVVPLNEMIKLFDVDRVNSSPAVFDGVKLKWMNSVYLREMDHQELWKLLIPFLEADGLKFEGVTTDWINKAVGALKTSFETLVEAVLLFHPLSDQNFEFSPESEEAFKWASTTSVITHWIENLKNTSDEFIEEAKFAELQKKIQTDCAVKGKEFFQALRVAIVGKPHGTELKQLVPLLSKKSLILRAEKTLARCLKV